MKFINVSGSTVEEITDNIKALVSQHDKDVFVLSYTNNAVNIISHFKAIGIKIACSPIFNTLQAVEIAKAGAYAVVPYISPDANESQKLKNQIEDIYKYYSFDTKIITSLEH